MSIAAKQAEAENGKEKAEQNLFDILKLEENSRNKLKQIIGGKTNSNAILSSDIVKDKGFSGKDKRYVAEELEQYQKAKNKEQTNKNLWKIMKCEKLYETFQAKPSQTTKSSNIK